MAITTKGELKTAIAAWSDNTDVDAYLDDFISQTTLLLNYGSEEINPLRTRDMEEVVDLPTTGGVATLPADYLEYSMVVDNGSYRKELDYIAATAAVQLYASSAAGPACDFTIIGQSLKTYPATSSNVELTYYQVIPDMDTDADTNWLLTKIPSLYLQGGLYHLGLFRRDDEMAQRSASLLKSYISGLSRTNFMSKYARSATRLRAAP